MVSVFSLRLDDKLNEIYYQYLVNKASEAISKKFLEFRNRDDAYRSLFAEFLARYVAIQHLKVTSNDLMMLCSSHGKPYFLGFENFHFNLSHSGEFVVCAISDSPVGIDVEKIIPLDIRLMASNYSLSEQADLYRQKPETELSYFYELWTLKESFIKKSGEGLSKQLDSFSIKIFNDGISINCDDITTKSVFFKQYDIDRDCKMAVCAESDDFGEVAGLSLEELVAGF